MEPLTMMLLAAALGAGTSLAGSGMQQRANKEAAAKLFTDEERERLAELQRQRAAGELGMSEAQELDLDAVLRAQRASSSRASQAERLQQQAASSASARDVFLQQAAAEAGRQQGITGDALVRQQAEQSAEQVQLAELAQLVNQRTSAAQLAAGGAGAGLTQAGAAASSALQSAATLDTGMSDAELLRLYQGLPASGGAAASSDMSGYV